MSQISELKPTQQQNLSQILQKTVETTRQVLQCDRVMIYWAKDLPNPSAIAESVAPKLPSLLGQKIPDPFLSESYLEMYCYGMSLTIDDIQTAELQPEAIAILENLDIERVAIAPIHVQEKLLAFLVAHQCSPSQLWETNTASILAEKANATGIALGKMVNESTNLVGLEMPSSNLNLAAKEQLFAEIQREIYSQQQQPGVLQTIVEKLRRLLECDRVLLFGLYGTHRDGAIIESVAMGWESVLNPAPESSLTYLEEDRHGKVRAWSDTSQEDAPAWYRQQLLAFKVRAGIVAPIAREGQLLGLAIAHQCSRTRHWQEREIYWITNIANLIGTMLDKPKTLNGNNQPLKSARVSAPQFARIIQKLRQSLKPTEILQAGVTEVHQTLQCDRALVYALNHDSYGKIVAESVSAGWTKAEGRVIQDPCFAARYLDKYRDGRVRAWNDIYQGGMTNCHIEQLERLEVKANLVVPIINEGRLFGLLVAQQCASTRQWQEAEIFWLTQVATQIGFALDNAQTLTEAYKLRQQAQQAKIWTGYFTEAVQQIRQSLQVKEVYQASVREVRRVLSCDRVLIYALNQDNYGEIVAESVAHGWTKGEGRVIKDPCFEARYLDKYRDGRVRVWNDIYQSKMTACHIEQLERLEVKANLVVPIVSSGKLFGLLVAQQCSSTRKWQQQEIDWLTQIAIQVALALENAQMQEQIEQYTKNTQDILNRATDSSINIQRTVENVTRSLANLHSSCDRFGEIVGQIKDLSKQLAQQSMNMTRTVSFSPTEGKESSSVVELSDRIFSLMQELFEATAQIDPLFVNIKTEIAAKTNTLQGETEQLMAGVTNFQSASEQLEQIVFLNQEMSNLVRNISDTLETQLQSSQFTQNSVDKLATISDRITRQSIALIKSLEQLTQNS